MNDYIHGYNIGVVQIIMKTNPVINGYKICIIPDGHKA